MLDKHITTGRDSFLLEAGSGGRLKQCPSCNSEVDDTLAVCPSCGFHFEGEESPNKTVMGLPAVNFDEDEPEIEKPAEDTNSTLFGFPAIEENQSQNSEDDLDEDSYDVFDETEATHLIPADQLQKEFEDDERRDAMVERSEPRGTIAGAPAVDENQGRVQNAWGLDDESSVGESSTSVVPAAVLLQNDSDNEDGAGFSRTRVEPDDEEQHGTLMGMSVKDFERSQDENFEKDDERSTQFAIPAVQRDEQKSAFDSDLPPSAPRDEPFADTTGPLEEREREDSSEDDAPTAMWSPSDELEDTDDPARKELLAKIRSGLDQAKKTHSTSQNARPSASSVDRPSGKQTGVVPGQPTAPKSETDPVTNPPTDSFPRGKEPPESTAPSIPSRSKLPDASELRARLKAKREALKTSRTAVGPDSIPEPDQAPNPKNSDDIDRMAENRQQSDDDSSKKAGGVLGVSYFHGKGDVKPEAPNRRVVANVDKLRIDTGEVPTASPDDDEATPLDLEMEPVQSTAESSEFDEDFAFADTNVASPELTNQFQQNAAEIESGGSGLFDKPITDDTDQASRSPKMNTEPTGPDPSLFSTEPDLQQLKATQERDLPGIDNHPTQPRSQKPDFLNDTDPDGAIPLMGGSSSPTQAPTTEAQPADREQTRYPQPEPANQAMQPTGGQPNAASSESNLHAAPGADHEVADKDARLFQTGFAILAGIGLLAAGGWGAAVSTSLMISIVFLFSALTGLISLTAAALPIPTKVKGAVWTIVGLLQIALNAGMLILEMSPPAPTVLAVCAGFGAIMAVVFPLVTKQIG